MRHLKHIFPLLLLFILGGCADDTLQWGGAVNTEDEIAIAFTTGDMATVNVATRALSLPSTDIDGIDLLIFDGDGNLASGQYFNKNQFIDGAAGAKAIKIKRQYAVTGTWYLIANAHTKISALNLYDSNGLPVGSPTLGDFENNTLTLPEALGSDNGNKAMLIAKQEVTAIPSPSDPAMSAFTLSRRFAKIGLTVADGVEFQVSGIGLFRTPTESKIDGTPTEWADYSEPYTGLDITDGTFSFLTLPVPDEMEEETYPEARLIIKGKTPVGRDENDNPIYEGATESYFAYRFPGKVASDHDYQLTLKKVVGAGASSAAEAAANPIGAVIEYKDNYAKSQNIVTDGERVIALPDTLRPAADATKVEFDVIWRGKDAGELLYYNYGSSDNLIAENSSVDSSWLTKIEAAAPVEMADQTTDTKGFKQYKTHFTLTLTENKGSAREAQLCFRLKGSEQLLPVLVVEQASANVNLDDYMNIKLEITSSGSTVTIDNYLLFIGNNPADGLKAAGVSPDENGSRIRNAGLHIPMPNGGVTYKYTISGLSGWTLGYGKSLTNDNLKGSVSGDTYTFTYTDSQLAASDYTVYDDAIILTKDGQTLTLDLYHTGFFHEYASKWYYYEVFTAGGQRWLDRNIGATSAGMAHLDASGYAGGEAWPMREGSAGERFSLEEARNALPAGWRLPTQGEFETLAMQSGFSSDRFTTGGATIFLPSYTFQTLTYTRNGSQSRTSMRAYFPHNRYAEGSSPAGDQGAGYYWTNTNTDNQSYYRSMKFVGQNVTPENMLTSRRLSLRCVSGEAVDNSTVLYSCQVKGYTHVFLYAEKDGEKTYLNTWPGTQVANEQTKGIRYNPFSFASYIDYVDEGYSLYVIFNNPTSSGTTSNVTAEAAKARQGIPFIVSAAHSSDGQAVNHNGQGYSSDASDKLVYNWKGENIVASGNWTDKPVEPQVEYRYALKGNFNKENWDAGKSSNYEFTVSADNSNIWILNMEVTDLSEGNEFVILRKEATQSGWTNNNDWGKTSGGKEVVLDTPMKIETNLGDNNNWKFTSIGKYTMKLDVEAMTLRVSKEEEPPVEEDVEYWYSPNQGDREKMTYDESLGVWTTTVNASANPLPIFSIQARTSENIYIKSYRPSENRKTVEYGVGMATDNSATTGNSFSFKEAGGFGISFDPINETVWVVPTHDMETFYINIPGDHNSWGDTGGQFNCLGISTQTYKIGKGSFKIKVWNGQEHWYGTNGAIEQGKWVTIEQNDGNMTIKGAQDNDSFKFEYNYYTKQLRVTKVTVSGARRRK